MFSCTRVGQHFFSFLATVSKALRKVKQKRHTQSFVFRRYFVPRAQPAKSFDIPDRNLTVGGGLQMMSMRGKEPNATKISRKGKSVTNVNS